MNQTDIKDLIADFTAVGIIASGAYMSVYQLAMPEFFGQAFGAAMAYLFIKHSPNSIE